MKKGMVILGFIFIFLFSPSALAQETHGCSDPSQIIMRLYNSNNSHVSLWNQTEYPYEICYDETFGGAYSGENPHQCSGTNNITFLAAVNNSHANAIETGVYDIPVCYGDLNCSIVAGACEFEDGTCVATISSESNAHLSGCGISGSYATSICCNIGQFGAAQECPNPNFCSENNYVCGNWTDYACGMEMTCDGSGTNPGGVCPQGEFCNVNGECETSNAYWSTTNNPSQAITELDIIVGETGALMNLLDIGLTLGQNVEFTLSSEGEAIRSINKVVDDETYFSASWTILLSDLEGRDLDEPFFFSAEGIDSGALELNILTECFDVSFCSGYSNQNSCELDVCGTSFRSVQSNNPEIVCGGDFGSYTYNCGCTWNVTESSCSPEYERVNTTSTGIPGFNPDWTGLCTYGEESTDICEDDDFLTYEWEGGWIDGEVAFTNDPDNDDFREESEGWYYDPLNNEGLRESEVCEQSQGSKTVPCPSQIKLPFFSFWNLFASLSLILGIYFVFSRRE